MKKQLITVLCAALVTLVSAENNKGKDYFGIGEYSTAKAIFESQLQQKPAEANYYLGEIAWAEGNRNDAASFFEKGIAADPLYPMNYVGKGKVMLKANQKEAEAVFSTVLKKNKKNPEVQVAIARAYYDNGLKDKYAVQLEVARKIGKKFPYVYLLEGDIFAAEGKAGEAAGKYEQAIYFDAQNVPANLKCAQVYESINAQLSIEKAKGVIAAFPDYTVAYRYLARAYNQNGFYPQAIEAYNTFRATDKLNLDDLTKLSSAYYFNGQYEESMKILAEAMAVDPNNFIVNRLRMYNASKTEDSTGIEIAQKFFAMNGNFIYQDNMAYAAILANAGQFEQALEQYNKVIATEGEKIDIIKELAPIYTKKRDHVKAAETYQKYIDLYGGIDVAEGADYYKMGQSWYSAGQAYLNDTTTEGKAKRIEYFTKADTAFGVVCVKSPESHIGYIWRGNANSGLDPETTLALAKPYYEKALEMILSKIEAGNGTVANYKKDLVTVYRYLAYYYYTKSDKDNCVNYCNKIMEIQPGNAVAKQLLDFFNPPAAPAKKPAKK